MTDTIRLAAVGDIMLGDHPVCFGHGVRSVARRNGLQNLLSAAIPTLSAHDIFFGNLECVLSDFNHDERKLASSELRGDPSSAETLNICRHNVFSVANNHMLQHGSRAFEETRELLQKNNANPIGLWRENLSNVVTIENAGVKLAFVGHSFRPEHFCKDNTFYAHGTPADVTSQIAAIKQEYPGHLIILSLHWGEEYLNTPSEEQIAQAHQFVDAGATLVLGHHPHTLQGIEEYNGGLIAYSLGNFLFDSWQSATRETAILSCEFSASGIKKYTVIPAYIDDGYKISLSAPATKHIPEKIRRYSQTIASRGGSAALSVAEYQQLAAKAYLRYRLECYFYFFTRIWKYKPNIIFASLFRSVLRRMGAA